VANPKTKKPRLTSVGNISPAEKEMTKFKYKDLKIACILRGMRFRDAVEADYPRLRSFFMNNYWEDIDREAINRYDDWVDGKLKDPILKHPTLRLGYVAREDEEGKSVRRNKRLKSMPAVKKKKAKKNETFGIRAGTKKEYTYKLEAAGKDVEETIKLVMTQFPDASNKSIKIWYKKAKDARLKPKTNEDKG
jgi:hypothetical protein